MGMGGISRSAVALGVKTGAGGEPAKSKEEDLELTTQIILDYVNSQAAEEASSTTRSNFRPGASDDVVGIRGVHASLRMVSFALHKALALNWENLLCAMNIFGAFCAALSTGVFGMLAVQRINAK